MRDRYLVLKDFNTQDWYIYDNQEDINMAYFQTEEDAIEYSYTLGGYNYE